MVGHLFIYSFHSKINIQEVQVQFTQVNITTSNAKIGQACQQFRLDAFFLLAHCNLGSKLTLYC
uniref:Uncharacterized protein n=1 Tax=Setaria italica TaxID=4555 RepID=K3XTI8_SETIT